MRAERPIRIGTRASALAMRQAELVRQRLCERFPNRTFALHPVTSPADRQPDAPLVTLGGEGVFVKELETALLKEEIDLAVHSLKDLPLASPQGLRIAAVLAREEARDALIARASASVEALPSGAQVGTSSLRRQSQLSAHRSDLRIAEIRGNVDTRLRKLDEGRYDAIVVAACGLQRLGLANRITQLLDISLMTPEPGQGALAVEARTHDVTADELAAALEDPVSRACVEAERAFLRALGGGCRVPIAAYAQVRDRMLWLRGAVLTPDGRQQLRGELTGPIDEPVALGERLATQLISSGALDLLKMRP